VKDLDFIESIKKFSLKNNDLLVIETNPNFKQYELLEKLEAAIKELGIKIMCLIVPSGTKVHRFEKESLEAILKSMSEPDPLTVSKCDEGYDEPFIPELW